MTLRYRYNGTEELHLPMHKKTVSKKGQIIEVEREINHPDFELLKEQEGKGKKQ